MTDRTMIFEFMEIKTIMDRLYSDVSGYCFKDVDTEKENHPEYEGFENLISIIHQLKQTIRGLPQDPEHIYGEITTESIQQTIDNIPDGISKGDVFYDLGSGIGKVCIQVFLSTTVSKCTGIELSSHRHNLALSVLKQIQTEYSQLFSNDRTLCFVNDDILNANFEDATLIFLCSRLFSEDLMEKIAQKIIKECSCLRHILSTKAVPVPKLKVMKTIKVYSKYAPQGEELMIYSP